MKKILKKSVLFNRMIIICEILVTAWNVRRIAVIGFFVGAVLETTAFIVSIYATAKLGSLLAQYVQGTTSSAIWFWLWIDILALALVGIGMWIMSYSKHLIYFRMVQWATHQFQSTLCRLDITDFYDTNVRNQINKVQGGYTWQVSNFTDATLDLIYAILRFLATAAVVSQITWWIIPLIALFLLPTLYAESMLAKVQWFVWDRKGDDRHVFWGLEGMIRQVKNQMELRSSQARSYVLDKISRMNQTFYKEQEQQYKKFNRLVLPARLLEAAGTAVGTVVVLRQFLAGAISLERYFFLSGALLRIGSALNNIFGTLSRMQEQFLFIENYLLLTKRKPQFIDKPNALKLTTTSPTITFEHVAFTYPGHSREIYSDLHFTIKSGERVAIVGENGAGKTTLIKLLLRYYKPTAGRILIDGVDLQDIMIESWYERLATLFQEFNQYPFSIAENIEIGRPETKEDKSRLDKAARLSSVDTFIEQYHHGWETILDNSFEKGVEPSGGQWQRVALARAFYRNASVLILDEPTAAIDAKAEYDIFNNIFAHFEGKSAIIVSHRFSTVRKADRILVFDKGQIIEEGDHKALISKNGLYHEMFTKQAEGYR